MRKLRLTAAVAAVLLQFAPDWLAPAQAQTAALQGRWTFTRWGLRDGQVYTGSLTIEASSRTVSNTRYSRQGRPIEVVQTGHAYVSGNHVSIIFNSASIPGYNVDRFECDIANASSLDCINNDGEGGTPRHFFVTRS